MSTWHVRHEGSPASVELPSADRVAAGLRDGEWEPTDQVRGPADRDWVAIEDHPTFADLAADLEPPPAPKPDDSHLDMNPLIDVALVLLIFFILTTSYESLRRAIDLPQQPTDDGAAAVAVQPRDLKDRAFEVEVRVDRGTPVVKVNGAPVTVDELEYKMAEAVRATKKTEVFARVAADVPWGIEAKVLDAAKAAGVTQVYWPKGK